MDGAVPWAREDRGAVIVLGVTCPTPASSEDSTVIQPPAQNKSPKLQLACLVISEGKSPCGQLCFQLWRRVMSGEIVALKNKSYKLEKISADKRDLPQLTFKMKTK